MNPGPTQTSDPGWPSLTIRIGMNKIAEKIMGKLSSTDMLSELGRLSGSELNSLLLALFKQKTTKISPATLLNHYQANRFVFPSTVDLIKLMETELACLKLAREQQFQLLNLSPLAPLGTCSVMGYVNQNKVVSALRGTEAVSDGTNVLALKIAADFQGYKGKDLTSKYATVHRHVRAQFFTNPNFSAHFSVFCLASGGLDKGNYLFEITQLKEHMSLLHNLLKSRFDENDMLVRFYVKDKSDRFASLINQANDPFWKNKKFEITERHDNKYYHTFQFKIFLKREGKEYDLADGGMVDWTQKILENKKHRLLISGLGLELVEKL
jgi:hypothetical protein